MIKQSKNKNKARGQSWANRDAYVKKWREQKEKNLKKKIARQNLLSVIQTLNHLLHPLKIPKSQCFKNSQSTNYTVNLTFFPKKPSKKALSYCSDFISAEDQLKGHWRAMILEAGCASSTLYLSYLQKYLLQKRTPCQNNLISPSPTKYSNKDKKSDFPLINKESQVPQHKNTRSKCKFLPLDWDFFVLLIPSPVLWSETI